MVENAINVWDFTIPAEKMTLEKLKELCKEWAKAWGFQLEKGESGYVHWQGRISTKVRSRKWPEWIKEMKWTPTSKENKDNMFYVFKKDTRIEGPWCDTDKETYIPRQFRNIKLYPWQEAIKNSAEDFDDRKINLIYDEHGNNGKSTVASICELMHGGIDMPPLNDFKELIALLCDICMDGNIRSPKIVFFDLPRAMDKDRLFGMYSAIEQVKKGKLYDCRYKYKCWWIDSPQIWVFSNILPDRKMLSADRWNLWKINNLTQSLEEFKEDQFKKVVKKVVKKSIKNHSLDEEY